MQVGPQADDGRGAGIAEGWQGPESATLDEMADTSKPKTDENITEKHTGKRRGRRPSPERRDAIRVAISKHGDQWRDHLYEIFADLDDQHAPLGDFLGMKIDLCDGHVILVKEWVDLDSADGDQRGRIVDALRKYL